MPGSGGIWKKLYFQNLYVGLEVGIRCKNLPSAPHRDGTHQKIGVAAGNAAGTATIRALRGLLIIPGNDRLIGKSLKLFPDLFKVKPLADS
jgi:hypothetical protein